MRFLALFGVLIGEAAMMVHPPPPIKMGRGMGEARTGLGFVTALSREPEGARYPVFRKRPNRAFL
jgi:hypothetical protein